MSRLRHDLPEIKVRLAASTMSHEDQKMSHVVAIVGHMEHFDIVQALVRSALVGSKDATEHQVERLAERLAADGDDKSANSLRSIVAKSRQVQPGEPLEFVMSGGGAPVATPNLQKLGLRTAVPVDRDSGAPLCEVIFPGQREVAPLLDRSTVHAINSLLEEWSQRTKLLEAGLLPSSSLLLYGPPGTGKTSLALYLASEIELPAVVARLDGLISSLLGNTARNLAALFDFCNRYDTVLILDEFDAVAKVRDDPNEVGEIKRVVNALLQNLDRRAGVGLSIGITNHELLLDTAIWRRFEHQIHLSLPAADIRLHIAKRLFANNPNAVPLSKVVAWATDSQSGADVRTFSMATMKQMVLGERASTPIESFKAAANSSGPRVKPEVQSALAKNDSDLAVALSQAEIPIGVSELGQLFGRDRRTIARWLGSRLGTEEEGTD